MIGVVLKEGEEKTAEEFFELFKVPWEYYKDNQNYPVVLSTHDSLKEFKARLILLYSSDKTSFDIEHKISVNSSPISKVLSKSAGHHFPVYRHISTLDTASDEKIELGSSAGEVIGIRIKGNNGEIIRIGYDLFQEIYFLLTFGQPSEYSLIPTLDIHISLLRKWILRSGIPLAEIPPVPAGHNFISCLTHDIDFAGVRRHKFDPTIFGFLYRALFVSLYDAIKRKSSWSKLWKNWRAVFSLPAVYAGLSEDFWNPFKRYREVENGFRSTFFIIPFKNNSGSVGTNNKNLRRAARYDVSDVKDEIQGLLLQGCEIGAHGIDAWRDAEQGGKEFERIHGVTGTSEIGIRMHWLYFNDQSPQILEDAGFLYDSSIGYNDAVGYRGGTAQVFRPIGLKRLLELPLHIQDTALFFPDRMSLTEEEAWILIYGLLDNTERYGGVLTINWHDRSLAPERLWENIFVKILEKFKKSNAWIDTAARVIRWFDKRRSVSFEELRFEQDKIKLRISSKIDDSVPDMMVRIHIPKNGAAKERCFDIPFRNVLNDEIPYKNILMPEGLPY